MFDVQEFKKRLRSAREAAGISQEEFAKKIKIARASASYYENPNNKSLPNVDVLYRISKALDVGFDWLMGESFNRKSENIDIGKETGLSDHTIKCLRELKADELNTVELLNELFEDGFDTVLKNYAYLRLEYYRANEESTTSGQSSIPSMPGIPSIEAIMALSNPPVGEDGEPIPGIFFGPIGPTSIIGYRLRDIDDLFLHLVRRVVTPPYYEEGMDEIGNREED